MQTIISGKDAYKKFKDILKECNCQKFLLVCDASFGFLGIKDFICGTDIPYVVFDSFTSNPLYEDVCKGVEAFRSAQCDVIVAVGGGSALDVAKCIKLYCKMDSGKNYLEQEYCDTEVPLIVFPTTAGTGSESTRYAVIYYEGKKQSVTHESIVPNYAVLEHVVLRTLPIYQKKCTLLDALCQGIEAWWSVNSTEESKGYSKKTVELIVRYMDAYLNENSEEAAEQIMLAANYSGRAINITQTTAAHAMSYKMTSLYGLPHGHAVAIGLPVIWQYMIKHTEYCIDPRGTEYLLEVMDAIAKALGAENAEAGIAVVEGILEKLNIERPKANGEELQMLVGSVNLTRLKNNPVALDEETLLTLYKIIVG